jgi:putative hydrolase
MKIIADTHMHTIASTHAYSTLSEMVHAAAQKHLYAVAITDHGNRMPGAPGKWYFENLKIIPRTLEGVLVLKGQETNVLGPDGRVDLAERDAEVLEWIVASIHPPVAKNTLTAQDMVTEAWLNVAKNPKVNVIGHSGSVDFPYDYEHVIPEFGRNGKLVELNEATFSCRQSSVSNCVQIMKLCKKYQVPIIVNSDAHFFTRVGCFDRSLKLLQELDFPEELVVNSSVVRFRRYLEQYTGVFGSAVS